MEAHEREELVDQVRIRSTHKPAHRRPSGKGASLTKRKTLGGSSVSSVTQSTLHMRIDLTLIRTEFRVRLSVQRRELGKSRRSQIRLSGCGAADCRRDVSSAFRIYEARTRTAAKRRGGG